MGKDKQEPEASEEYSTKEELKDEAAFFGKDVVLGVVKAGSRLVRGIVNVGRHHPKVENLEAEVTEHIEELEQSESEE